MEIEKSKKQKIEQLSILKMSSDDTFLSGEDHSASETIKQKFDKFLNKRQET